MYDEFNRRCGEILNIAAYTEEIFEWFISGYFCNTIYDSDKNSSLEKIFLVRMDISRKLEIFENICKYEKIKKELIHAILEDAKYIQRIRNTLVHRDIYPGDFEIMVLKKGEPYNKSALLKVTDDLVKKVHDCNSNVAMGVAEIQHRLEIDDLEDLERKAKFAKKNKEFFIKFLKPKRRSLIFEKQKRGK
jgi:hypothetical protein